MIDGLLQEIILLEKAKKGEELTDEELSELLLIMLRPDKKWTQGGKK